MLGTVDDSWLIVAAADTLSRHEYSQNVRKWRPLLQFPSVVCQQNCKSESTLIAVTPENRICNTREGDRCLVFFAQSLHHQGPGVVLWYFGAGLLDFQPLINDASDKC